MTERKMNWKTAGSYSRQKKKVTKRVSKKDRQIGKQQRENKDKEQLQNERQKE